MPVNSEVTLWLSMNVFNKSEERLRFYVLDIKLITIPVFLFFYQNSLVAKDSGFLFCQISGGHLYLTGVFAPTLFSKAYGNLVCDACTSATGGNGTSNASGPFVCQNCHYDLVTRFRRSDCLNMFIYIYSCGSKLLFLSCFHRKMELCSATTSSEFFVILIV